MNRKIVLTGATGGIGKAISSRLVSSGDHVFGIGRDPDHFEALRAELGDHFHPMNGDVRDKKRMEQLAETILSETGAIDCLINNAGVLRLGETHLMPESDIEEQIDTMVKGTIYMTRIFLPSMIRHKKGLIINMGSISGEKAAPKMAVYGASKAAIIHFTKSVALEYASDGIRALCICPGTVETTLMDKMLFSMIQKKVPLKRLARPEEIASLVDYLLSDDAAYMTGTVINIDGGVSL